MSTKGHLQPQGAQVHPRVQCRHRLLDDLSCRRRGTAEGVLFCHYTNRMLQRYTLLEAHSRTTLRLSPFLAFRDVKMLTHRNDQYHGDYGQTKSGVTFCLYPGYPTLYLQLSRLITSSLTHTGMSVSNISRSASVATNTLRTSTSPATLRSTSRSASRSTSQLASRKLIPTPWLSSSLRSGISAPPAMTSVAVC